MSENEIAQMKAYHLMNKILVGGMPDYREEPLIRGMNTHYGNARDIKALVEIERANPQAYKKALEATVISENQKPDAEQNKPVNIATIEQRLNAIKVSSTVDYVLYSCAVEKRDEGATTGFKGDRKELLEIIRTNLGSTKPVGAGATPETHTWSPQFNRIMTALGKQYDQSTGEEREKLEQAIIGTFEKEAERVIENVKGAKKTTALSASDTEKLAAVSPIQLSGDDVSLVRA